MWDGEQTEKRALVGKAPKRLFSSPRPGTQQTSVFPNALNSAIQARTVKLADSANSDEGVCRLKAGRGHGFRAYARCQADFRTGIARCFRGGSRGKSGSASDRCVTKRPRTRSRVAWSGYLWGSVLAVALDRLLPRVDPADDGLAEAARATEIAVRVAIGASRDGDRQALTEGNVLSWAREVWRGW